MNSKSIYPISLVVNWTGLSAHFIRTWESRYEAVKPLRTATNRRLYRDADIIPLQTLGRLVKSRHSISHIAGLTSEELVKLKNVDTSGRSKSDSRKDIISFPRLEQFREILEMLPTGQVK